MICDINLRSNTTTRLGFGLVSVAGLWRKRHPLLRRKRDDNRLETGPGTGRGEWDCGSPRHPPPVDSLEPAIDSDATREAPGRRREADVDRPDAGGMKPHRCRCYAGALALDVELHVLWRDGDRDAPDRRGDRRSSGTGSGCGPGRVAPSRRPRSRPKAQPILPPTIRRRLRPPRLPVSPARMLQAPARQVRTRSWSRGSPGSRPWTFRMGDIAPAVPRVRARRHDQARPLLRPVHARCIDLDARRHRADPVAVRRADRTDVSRRRHPSAVRRTRDTARPRRAAGAPERRGHASSRNRRLILTTGPASSSRGTPREGTHGGEAPLRGPALPRHPSHTRASVAPLPGCRSARSVEQRRAEQLRPRHRSARRLLRSRRPGIRAADTRRA